MLHTRNYPLILQPPHTLPYPNPTQIRVRSKPLPRSPRLWCPPQPPRYRRKCNVHPLDPILHPHRSAPEVHQLPIPRTRRGDPGGEDGDLIHPTQPDGAVLQAEVGEVEAGDGGNDISGARAEGETGAGGEGNFLQEGEFGGCGPCEDVGGVPGELWAGCGELGEEVIVKEGVDLEGGESQEEEQKGEEGRDSGGGEHCKDRLALNSARSSNPHTQLDCNGYLYNLPALPTGVATRGLRRGYELINIHAIEPSHSQGVGT